MWTGMFDFYRVISWWFCELLRDSWRLDRSVELLSLVRFLWIWLGLLGILLLEVLVIVEFLTVLVRVKERH